MKDDNVDDAILRKAVGYDVQEIVEEYSGENELLKRKVSSKHIPPDMSAIKTILEIKGQENDLAKMSDEELEQLKTKLLGQLKDLTKGESDESNNSNKQD
ncbi:MAG: hypothetical protein K2I23_05655 [Clostridia bacterium]|nr:hypothetical protein [Clostridia bacterium]